MSDRTTAEEEDLAVVRLVCLVCRQIEYVWQEGYEPPLDEEPCSAPAGSPAKIEVMIDRARRGRALFHPDDDCSLAPPAQESNREHARTLPRGVHWLTARQKYQARVTIRGQRRHLGLFGTVAQAVAAIEAAQRDSAGRDSAGNSGSGPGPACDAGGRPE